jgi:hypothetical protein
MQVPSSEYPLSAILAQDRNVELFGRVWSAPSAVEDAQSKTFPISPWEFGHYTYDRFSLSRMMDSVGGEFSEGVDVVARNPILGIEFGADEPDGFATTLEIKYLPVVAGTGQTALGVVAEQPERALTPDTFTVCDWVGIDSRHMASDRMEARPDRQEVGTGNFGSSDEVKSWVGARFASKALGIVIPTLRDLGDDGISHLFDRDL